MSKQNEDTTAALATLQATLNALQTQHTALQAEHKSLQDSLVTFTLNSKLGATSAYSYFESANGLKVTVTKSGLKAGATTVRVVGDCFDVKQGKAAAAASAELADLRAKQAKLEAQLAELLASKASA